MDQDSLKERISAMKSSLDERSYRIYLGRLALSLGRGGRTLISRLSGSSVNTVKRGMEEAGEPQTNQNPENGSETEGDERIRRKGGGRKPAARRYPNLRKFIEEIIDGGASVNDERTIRWTNLSLFGIRDILETDYGIKINHTVVSKELDALGYSKRRNSKKSLKGERRPDPAAQFEHISRASRVFIDAGEPVIFIDCGKKENLGTICNGVRKCIKSGDPCRRPDHDFPVNESASADPCGMCEVSENLGTVYLEACSDAAEFAGSCVCQWWRHIGKAVYPNAKKLYIVWDGGGMEASSLRLWKLKLANLAESAGLKIHVSRISSGTWKWSRTGHRLFCCAAKPLAGEPFIDVNTVVSVIGSETTANGPTAMSAADNRDHETGSKVSCEDCSHVDIEQMNEMDDWNYIVGGFCCK
ncbi:MAG: ISAzo13 family transposase [Succinivibrionaceae bacterium]|nr:ISAzo13 family transposase [Succinivibrionaceae bacterium]